MVQTKLNYNKSATVHMLQASVPIAVIITSIQKCCNCKMNIAESKSSY